MAEAPAYTPLPRDYSQDFAAGARGAVATQDHAAQPAGVLFTEAGEEAERDLDVPAFMRRLQF
jgi:hypothetical protein